MSPLPGWQVLPPRWAEHHRPTAESTQTAPGSIYRMTDGPAPYPKPEGWTGARLIHETFFRVQQMNREGGATPGEQPTRERQYRLSMAVGGPELQSGERGDVVRVIGREFRIQQVLHGSELWEVDLLCTDNLTQQNPV